MIKFLIKFFPPPVVNPLSYFPLLFWLSSVPIKLLVFFSLSPMFIFHPYFSYLGIPAAVISVGGIDLLCNLMLVENEQVSGTAAIALGYLSFNFMAERILLNKWDTVSTWLHFLSILSKPTQVTLWILEIDTAVGDDFSVSWLCI